jgi:hypothetical protein
MRLTTIICGGLLSTMAGGSAVACTLPKLPLIPPKEQVAGKEAEISVAMNEYSTGIDAYAACVRAELDAAGGDNAPGIVKRILISRNNTAVAEKEFMIKLYTDNVAPIAPVDPTAPGAPANRGRP